MADSWRTKMINYEYYTFCCSLQGQTKNLVHFRMGKRSRATKSCRRFYLCETEKSSRKKLVGPESLIIPHIPTTKFLLQGPPGGKNELFDIDSGVSIVELACWELIFNEPIGLNPSRYGEKNNSQIRKPK